VLNSKKIKKIGGPGIVTLDFFVAPRKGQYRAGLLLVTALAHLSIPDLSQVFRTVQKPIMQTPILQVSICVIYMINYLDRF
jgi:hypothetical protein